MKHILITGGAGFIGSNLTEYFLNKGYFVRCLDDFSTGYQHNIEEFFSNSNYELFEGDIRDLETCKKAVKGMDYLGTRSPEENRRLVKVVNDPYEACHQAHAVAVLTEWDEFKTYNWQKIYGNMYKPAFVFDGRNILNKEAMEGLNFNYYGIGT